LLCYEKQQVEKILDLGYLGVKNDFPTVKYVLPFLSQMRKANTIENIPNQE
jgi:hypothetical protein